MSESSKVILNTRGLNCPEPVMLLHKSIRGMAIGQLIDVIATDPSSLRDIPKFCQFLGHELLKREEDNGVFYYTIKKQ